MANSPFLVSYPSKLRGDGSASGAPPITDYVTFTTIENIRPPFDNARGLQALANYNVDSNYKPIRTNGDVPAAVSMYMPQKVTENYQQNWSNVNLEYEISKVSRNVPLNAGEAAQKYAEKTGFKTIIEQLNKLSNANLTENAILSATGGIVYNPMAEVLYEGPEFRTFSYNFTLFTSSQQDAQNIYRIVRFFRNASVPSYTTTKFTGEDLNSVLGLAAGISLAKVTGEAGSQLLQARLGGGAGKAAATADATNNSLNAKDKLGGDFFNNITGELGNLSALGSFGLVKSGIGVDSRFISQPPLILVQYKRGTGLHPYINSPKPCIIKSLDIDFTPSGSYTIMNNFGEKEVATVVATTISLTLVETRVVYREDFYTLPPAQQDNNTRPPAGEVSVTTPPALPGTPPIDQTGRSIIPPFSQR